MTTRRTFAKGGLLALTIMSAAGPPAVAQDNKPFKIGHLSDLSGMVVDLSGPGTTTSMRIAIEDFGGNVLGRPIELVTGDHLNKPDVGISLARKFYDEGVNAIFDVGITSVALGVQQLAKEKNRTVIFLSTASADLTGKNCSPNGLLWTYDSFSGANGVVRGAQSNGGKSWYFLTVDYAYGVNSERDAMAMIKAGGGNVVGSARHPFETTDFSSDLLKAQNSGAQVIGLATTTVHVANIIKQSDDFGIRAKQVMAPLALTLHDVKAMGLKTAQGLLSSAVFYWDENDQTRAFSKRYFERFKKYPNEVQASAYGAVMHYLNAVKAVGSDDTTAILAKMKATPINDFMTKDGKIREDGRVLRELKVLQVKKPEESKGEWDLYKIVSTIPAAEAFAPADPTVCSLVK
jgi:branched-chain amino acid transport system substrate-binding protein